MPSSRWTRLGPGKQAAIEALLHPGSVEDAAREANTTTKKLLRWMKDPEFMAALRAAVRANNRQSIASLGHAPAQTIRSILYIMYHGKKPVNRLKAARRIIRFAKDASEIEEFAADLADAERMVAAAGEGRKSRSGHGAKFPRRAEQTIVALLEQPSVAAAARTLDMRPQTVRLWMQDAAFNAKYAMAACAVYGPAMMLAQQHLGDAVVVIRNLSNDSSIPEETRLEAASYRVGVFQKNVITHLASRQSGMESGGAGTGEPQAISQTAMGSDLHQRLHQLKSRLAHAGGQSGIRRMILVHAVDGRRAGSSVAGADGRHRWWDAPQGFRKDDLITDDPQQDDPIPVEDVAA